MVSNYWYIVNRVWERYWVLCMHNIKRVGTVYEKQFCIQNINSM